MVFKQPKQKNDIQTCRGCGKKFSRAKEGTHLRHKKCIPENTTYDDTHPVALDKPYPVKL